MMIEEVLNGQHAAYRKRVRPTPANATRKPSKCGDAMDSLIKRELNGSTPIYLSGLRPHSSVVNKGHMK